MELMGDKIVLGPYSLEQCHEFYMGYITDSAMTFDTYIYSKEIVDRYYQDKVLDPTRRFFGIYHQDKIIGEIQLKRIDFVERCATLSIVLSNDLVKGKGFGTQAELLIIAYATNELGLQVIYADAVHRNIRSKHILKKLGFKHLYDDEKLAYYELTM